MAKKFVTEVQLWILVYHTVFVLSASTNPIIGDADESSGNRQSARRLYLNTERPATCNGTVSVVRYCYYGQANIFVQRTYRSLIALYRPVNVSHYKRISETVSVTKRSYPFPLTPQADNFLPGFSCDTQKLTSSVEVQTGDIVGFCTFNSGGISQINMVTFRGILPVAIAGYSMMFEGADTAGCNTGEMPRVVGDHLQQAAILRILHISAEIIPASMPNITQEMTTVMTTEIEPNVTMFPPTPGAQTDTLFLVITVGGALLGLLFLIVLVVIIVNIVMAIRRRKKNPATQAHRILYHGNSAVSLVPQDYEAEEDDITNIPHPYQRAENVFTDEQSQPIPVESSHTFQNSTSSSENYYTACSSSPWRRQHSYFVLEGPNCSYDELLAKNKVRDIYANVKQYHEPARQEVELYSQLSSCGINIDRSSIQVQGHLGSGQFGNVEEGVWRFENRNIRVALKMLNQSSTPENRLKFLQEAAIMVQFRHPNVVLLYGIISNNGPITLVVQLVEKGDLKKYLWTLRPNPGELPAPNLPNLLLSFCQHVALGMQYLSGKGFVHRDLAARNILVSKDNICMIADFGLSRDLMDDNYYISHGGKIPVKWTAPEAIDYKKYSTASDVWSYGCLLYEIWSLGHQPFEEISNIETMRFVRKRKRLSPPPGCPRATYDIMIQCWHPTTVERPKFRMIHLSLTDSEQDVLSIPREALDTHQLAGVLGSPLKAGERMYEDLKRKYEASNMNNNY